MNDETLRKCPFCGGDASVRTFRTFDERVSGIRDKYYVECCTCGVNAPITSFDKDRAIAAWNRREDRQSEQ